MKNPLHVLIVEDSPDDARLLIHELKHAGYEVTAERVETAAALKAALDRGQWELVLCDFVLPGFGGEAALRIVKDSARDIPFIFVSGTIGEDIAVGAMKAGAHDYVMKGNLTRLIPAIQRELQDAVERSQHREAETQMRMSEHKYRHLFRSMSDAALLVSEETEKIIDANEQASLLFGRTRDELLGLTSAVLYPPSTPDEVNGPPPESAWHVPGGCESRVQRKNGSTVPVHVSITRIRLYDRSFLLTLFHDISARKHAEAALNNVLRHARAMFMRFEIVAPPGWEQQDAAWAAANFRWQTLPFDELVAQEVLPVDVPPGTPYDLGWARAKHPDDEQAMGLTAHSALVSGAATWRQEFRAIDRHGRLHWFSQVASIEKMGHGRWQVMTINTDITERVLAEEALRTSEERLSTVFHLSPTAICIVRAADNRFVEVNEAFVLGTGYTRDEIIGNTPSGLNLWEYPPERDAIMREVHEKGTAIAFKLRGRRKSGDVGVGLSSLTRIPLNGEEHYLWLILDITELERAGEAQRESDQRFRQLTENIDEVFWLTDLSKSQIIYVSPTYNCVWGRTCESAYETAQSWPNFVHPEDRERVRAALELQATGNYDLEYRIVRPDGSIRWIHERAFPVRDAHGKPYRIAGVASDMTVRRELEEQFRQSQKMEAVGQLAGGIAHDFNNLLTVIQMQSSVLLADMRQHRGIVEGVQQIMDASKRAANLTRQLLTFSRRQQQAARNLDLGEVIVNMTKMLRRILGEDISWESRIAPGLPQVYADPGMMEQVLMNLVVNARDAMPGGGRLAIALDAATFDIDYAAAHPPTLAGRFVCLKVNDTGSGIPPEIRDRIFEPFFTTKEVGSGTGLGLATVFGIVQQHHGWIEVESEVGVGTTFRIFLPALEKNTISVIESGDSPVARGGTETILLVEDENTLRSISSNALRQLGYRVFEAANAADAVQRWTDSQGKVDLLLTDLVLPGGTSGKELANQLLRRRPALRVIYTTGYSTGFIGRQLKLEVGKNYLEKPYSLADLTTIVRRRLDES
jgi:PAS domain S-box-containing protein